MSFITLRTGPDKRQVLINADRINYLQQIGDKTIIYFDNNNTIEVHDTLDFIIKNPLKKYLI